MDDAKRRPVRALLLVDHGSRQPAAHTLLLSMARRAAARRPDLHVEIAHMEITRPSLAEGVAACQRAGAREIVVHPYFLSPGLHTSATLPRLIEQAAAAHPELEIRLSEPLGEHEKLLDVVLERVDAVAFEPAQAPQRRSNQ